MRRPIDEINEQFELNLGRVQGLLNVFGAQSSGRGHPTRGRTDILRAAVVFLHMALEDYLRALAKWKWLASPTKDVLDGVRLPGRSEKLSVGDLVQFGNSSVKDVLREFVEEYLNNKSFNNYKNDVAQLLESICVSPQAVPNGIPGKLEQLMERRHQIAHQGDRYTGKPGRGRPKLRPLAKGTVFDWREAVKKFQESVDAAISARQCTTLRGVLTTRRVSALSLWFTQRYTQQSRLPESVKCRSNSGGLRRRNNLSTGFLRQAQDRRFPPPPNN